MLILSERDVETLIKPAEAIAAAAEAYCLHAAGHEKAGDLALALKSGALSPDRIVAEIGACLDRGPPEVPGTDVIVFKSMGLAVQDGVLAAQVIARAEREGIGIMIDLEGVTTANAA
jgi:ornithine cyclodeaminase/alanine dehydrogenase-like protein (mu-crystallin family)